MPRLLTSIVAAAATLVPVLALAENPNQQAAEQIAAHLTQSGQLKHFRIAVKFKDGTAWLQGQVCDAEQAKTALKAGVRAGLRALGVVNNLTVVPFEPRGPFPHQDSVRCPARTLAACATVRGKGFAAGGETRSKARRDKGAPARPPKLMLAIFEPFRRPTHEATLPAEDPAQESQTGARCVSASFTAAARTDRWGRVGHRRAGHYRAGAGNRSFRSRWLRNRSFRDRVRCNRRRRRGRLPPWPVIMAVSACCRLPWRSGPR